MTTLSPEFWMQLIVTVVSILLAAVGGAWAISRAINKVNMRLVGIETTVLPYGSQIGKLQACQLELRERVTGTEVALRELAHLRTELQTLRNRIS